MNQSHLIKKAILSEKSYQQMEHGLYTFLVDRRATKDEIAKIIERQFSVSVAKVRVLNKAGKTKRIYGTRKTAKAHGGKKAVVFLQKGQSIVLFQTKKEKSKKTVAKTENKPTSTESTDSKKGKGLLSRFKRSKGEK